MQVATEEDGLGGFTQLRKRFVDGMLHIGAAEAAQDVFGVGGAQFQRSRILDHLVVLLRDQLPVDRPRQDRRKAEVLGRLVRSVEPLRCDGFQPGQQFEAQKPAEGEGHFALSVAVDVLPLYLHVGAVPEDAFDHGRNFRGGAPLELRVDTSGFSVERANRS